MRTGQNRVEVWDSYPHRRQNSAPMILIPPGLSPVSTRSFLSSGWRGAKGDSGSIGYLGILDFQQGPKPDESDHISVIYHYATLPSVARRYVP